MTTPDFVPLLLLHVLYVGATSANHVQLPSSNGRTHHHQSRTDSESRNNAHQAFSVIWNAPSDKCGSKWNITIDTKAFSIKANAKQSFYGSEIVLFYEHELGLYPYLDKDGKKLVPRNGGVPQKVNMSRHLSQMGAHIEAAIPDPDFSGLGVIDYEKWYPLWWGNSGEMIVYKHYSMSLVREKHPGWPESRIKLHAKHQFDKAAKEFMLKTLNYAKMLRPKAVWGFYGFPSCSYKVAPTGTCTHTYQKNNDRLKWMFDASTAFYPSVYLKERMLSWPQEQRHAYIQSKLRESKRLQSTTAPQSVFVYITYAYNNYADNLMFYEKADLCSSIKQSSDTAMTGVVLWGSWASVSKAYKCTQIAENLSDLLGPYTLLIQDMAAKCAQTKCHGHGRCTLPFSAECRTITPLSEYTCTCDPGYVPPDCAHELLDYFNMGYSLGKLQRQSNALQEDVVRFLRNDTQLRLYL